MQCPTCASTDFSPIRFGGVFGGGRNNAVACCLNCRRVLALKARK